ncbi:major head protein [Burkholderia phage vB_BglM_WTB]
MKQSKTHLSLGPRKVRAFDMSNGSGKVTLTNAAVAELAKLGIVFDSAIVSEQIELLHAGTGSARQAFDSAYTAPITQASIPTPLQFLQQWLPGFVKVMTAARKIDDILGIKTVGSWEDQEIVQGIVEPSGTAMEYGDLTNIPLASWKTNFERRTIVRGEMGIQVGLLEEGRASAMRLNSAETKRQASAVSLEMFRNAIGFYGWQSAVGNRTFGFLNDPGLLPAIATTTNGWLNSTFQSIVADIRLMLITLRTQSQDNIDPEKVDITLVLPMTKVDLLSVVTDFGISVRDWLKQTYPRVRVISAPELAGGSDTGTDLAYMFAESIDSAVDGSSDGGEVFAQLVQTKFMTLGVEKRAKVYVEDYSNASAGVLLKRPWAVVRLIGI